MQNFNTANTVHVQGYAVNDDHSHVNSGGLPQTTVINEAGAREFLTSYKWPTGLQSIFIDNLKKVPIRFFICDDSGSMVSSDGKKLVEVKGKMKKIGCSRWSELSETLKFHVGIAKSACAPSEFRLLNNSAPIMIGTNDHDENNRYNTMMNVLNSSPSGGTPLCRHIREIIEIIRGLEHELRSTGRRAAVIICTDGESSDGDIAAAMRPLQNLPVWVVVRLCTDEDKIVNYWNNIDNQLELDMDVLDDLWGEAEEVHENNPWLTYTSQIHQLREFGIPIREFDMLDERLLSLEEIHRFANFIYGTPLNQIPLPQHDWSDFAHYIAKQNKKTTKVYSPLDNRETDWINVSRLNAAYKKSGCIIS